MGNKAHKASYCDSGKLRAEREEKGRGHWRRFKIKNVRSTVDGEDAAMLLRLLKYPARMKSTAAAAATAAAATAAFDADP
jgi:hypothetical protein